MDATKKKAGIIILCFILVGAITTGVVFALHKNTPKKHGEDVNAAVPDDDPTHGEIDPATQAPDDDLISDDRSKTTPVPDGGPADGETDENTIVYYADLTHDGTDEKIVVDLTYVDTPATGEEQTVCVYSGDTLIWSTHADTVHAGWNGVYLYEGNDGYYLMQWTPYGVTGLYHFAYEVFSLTDSGTAISMDSREIEFSQKDADTDPEELTQKIIEFCNGANEYLSSSILLIDTDGGAVAYSTAENQMTRQYDSSALLRELGME